MVMTAELLKRKSDRSSGYAIIGTGILILLFLRSYSYRFLRVHSCIRLPGNFQFHHGFGSLPPVLNSRPVNRDNLGTQIARLGSLMDWPAKTGPSGPSYGGW